VTVTVALTERLSHDVFDHATSGLHSVLCFLCLMSLFSAVGGPGRTSRPVPRKRDQRLPGCDTDNLSLFDLVQVCVYITEIKSQRIERIERTKRIERMQIRPPRIERIERIGHNNTQVTDRESRSVTNVLTSELPPKPVLPGNFWLSLVLPKLQIPSCELLPSKTRQLN